MKSASKDRAVLVGTESPLLGEREPNEGSNLLPFQNRQEGQGSRDDESLWVFQCPSISGDGLFSPSGIQSISSVCVNNTLKTRAAVARIPIYSGGQCMNAPNVFGPLGGVWVRRRHYMYCNLHSTPVTHDL